MSPLINNISRNHSKDFEIYKSIKKNLYISTYPKKNNHYSNQNSFFNSSTMSNENISIIKNIKNLTSPLNSTRLIKKTFLPGIDLHKIKNDINNQIKEINNLKNSIKEKKVENINIDNINNNIKNNNNNNSTSELNTKEKNLPSLPHTFSNNSNPNKKVEIEIQPCAVLNLVELNFG